MTQTPRDRERPHLDDVSKAIIEQLQQDGRRSYAAIGKVVGLSEAAVRQRVQRLLDAGVMQVVAVTDPLELGFARQAMIGIRVNGPLEPVADALAELAEVDYVVVTAGSYDLLVEAVCESDEHLLELISEKIRNIRCGLDRDVHVPQAAQADLLVGCALSGYAGLSLWHETVGDAWDPRPPLAGDTDADVVVVGAGYTGLWTAYYLAEADPTLRIVVLEAEVAGYGASGRNGGWCSALFPASLGAVAGLDGGTRAGALAQHAAMRATVDEVVRVAAAEGIDAHVAKGGTISLVRSAAQLRAGRGRRSPTRGPGAAVRTTCGSSTRPRQATSWPGHPHPGRDATPLTARRSIPPASCAAWPTPSSGAADAIHERPP